MNETTAGALGVIIIRRSPWTSSADRRLRGSIARAVRALQRMFGGAATANVVIKPHCPYCGGTGWVCENHSHLAWTTDPTGCQCGAGMPCECQRANGLDQPHTSKVIYRAERCPALRNHFSISGFWESETSVRPSLYEAITKDGIGWSVGGLRLRARTFLREANTTTPALLR